jgi:hypothetical protein
MSIRISRPTGINSSWARAFGSGIMQDFVGWLMRSSPRFSKFMTARMIFNLSLTSQSKSARIVCAAGGRFAALTAVRPHSERYKQRANRVEALLDHCILRTTRNRSARLHPRCALAPAWHDHKRRLGRPDPGSLETSAGTRPVGFCS